MRNNDATYTPVGVVNINKPKGVSSSFVVVKLKKLLGIKRVGHMGTLDPLASGVLPICVGKATRLFDYFLKKKKTYVATFKFGEQTDTLDLEGHIVKTSQNLPNREQVEEAIKSFLGDSTQVPPIYSSKKIDGQASYDLARKNVIVALKPAPITIFDYKILEQINRETYKFLITCSAGTYIRALARDLGEELGTCATMTDLVRIESGEFKIENAIDFDTLTKEKVLENIIPLEVVLKDFDSICLDDSSFKNLLNGLPVAPNSVCKEGLNYALLNKGVLFGIGEVKSGKLRLKTYFGN